MPPDRAALAMATSRVIVDRPFKLLKFYSIDHFLARHKMPGAA
ncbi:hypothetical protein USDA257_c27210 [Sinorhizobium fredii USDA 257]|uniref:Uncharacterized protein n=1 Tax=Sinorhizobium fredii (strain USDA 257) TaxID=1185652 RepID=I3X5Y8_SINF2|nr:hypothetical protein USDA257_c27210 [Sinorhizobium fredii USDA 257]